jgi:hypothetical protein
VTNGLGATSTTEDVSASIHLQGERILAVGHQHPGHFVLLARRAQE